METKTLVAPDISCEHCQHAKVDIPTKTVNFTYDPQKVTLAKIEEVLDDTGYTVAK
jgi:copper chaperone